MRIKNSTPVSVPLVVSLPNCTTKGQRYKVQLVAQCGSCINIIEVITQMSTCVKNCTRTHTHRHHIHVHAPYTHMPKHTHPTPARTQRLKHIRGKIGSHRHGYASSEPTTVAKNGSTSGIRTQHPSFLDSALPIRLPRITHTYGVMRPSCYTTMLVHNKKILSCSELS